MVDPEYRCLRVWPAIRGCPGKESTIQSLAPRAERRPGARRAGSAPQRTFSFIFWSAAEWIVQKIVYVPLRVTFLE